jgi:cytochrome c6
LRDPAQAMRSQQDQIMAYCGCDHLREPTGRSHLSFAPFIMKHLTKISTCVVFLFGVALSYAAPAAENWENHCTKCHGADGKGQTKAGRKLQVKDYTDAKVQADMTDEEMTKIISDGANDKAGKEKMKAYKGEISPEEIKDLVAYVRKFKS